ncbi:MAG: hypothetical protein U1E27_13245 [Kiritimatiellia bacterium]|nr:hypothetical protein [Kiritimatiellia bacterium]
MNDKRRAGSAGRACAAGAILFALLVSGSEARNAVGYIKKSVPAGFSMMSIPFEQIGGSAQTLDSVFGEKLPDTSEVILYTQDGGYNTYTYFEGDGWYDENFEPAGMAQLPRGIGFWVKNTAASEIEIMLRGQVPTKDKAITLSSGYQMVSFGFAAPTAPQLEDGLFPNDTDELIAFGPGGFETITYFEGDGWLNEGYDPAALVLEPGVSYWYKRVGAGTTWNQSKPYAP